MFNRTTIKKAIEINLSQAIEALDMHPELRSQFMVFFNQRVKINNSDDLSDAEFLLLVSEVRESLETIKLPNN